MIYKGGKLILLIQKTMIDAGNSIQKNTKAIYKGSQLVWRTVYNAIKSCFGSGIWIGDKPWLGNDTWKNN